MKYEEALNLVKYGFKVYRPNWNNAYIYLFIFSISDVWWDIILSNSYGGYFTDGIWCIGKFPYYPLKEDKKANDWDFIVEV